MALVRKPFPKGHFATSHIWWNVEALGKGTSNMWGAQTFSNLWSLRQEAASDYDRKILEKHLAWLNCMPSAGLIGWKWGKMC